MVGSKYQEYFGDEIVIQDRLCYAAFCLFDHEAE